MITALSSLLYDGTTHWYDGLEPYKPLKPWIPLYPHIGMETVIANVTTDPGVWKLSEDKNTYTVQRDFPGFGPEDVEMKFADKYLTVVFPKESHPSWSQRLPENADPSTLKAVLKHGRMTVTVAVRAESQPRSIPVSG